MNPPIVILSITATLDGFCVTWREEDGNIRHNTATRHPRAWIEGYRNGRTLQELQADPLTS
jgi:hypothetical protein